MYVLLDYHHLENQVDEERPLSIVIVHKPAQLLGLRVYHLRSDLDFDDASK